MSLNPSIKKTSYSKKIKRQQILNSVLRDYPLYLMLLPAIASYIIFHYIPFYGIQIAFRNYTPGLGIRDGEWVGLKYFIRFFESYYFGTLIRNTLSITLYTLAAGFPIPILLSLLLNELKNKRFKQTVQTLSYAPHFISTVVLCGMLYVFFNPTYGPIVLLGNHLGLNLGNALTEPRAFKHLYVWSGIWQDLGWNCIIYLAALSGVDQTLHEAAIIDGASRLQRICYINWPTIFPTIMITLILNCGSILNVGFEKVFLLQNDLNISTSQVISTYVYEQGLLGGSFSSSTAIGLFNNVINFIFVMAVNQISKKITKISLF